MHRRIALFVLNSIGATHAVPRRIRWLLIRAAGIQCRTWNVRERCFFGGSSIEIGRSTFVNRGCTFDNLGPIRIGSHCALGMEVMLITSDHVRGGSLQRAGTPTSQPIAIGDGCWLGARATVLPGSVIGAGTIVAAGAVVRGELAPNSIYAGVPATLVRTLDG